MAGTGYYAGIYRDDDEMTFKDDSELELGTGADVVFKWDGTDLHMNALADDQVWNIGDGTLSFDVKTFGNTANDYMEWDASNSRLNLVATTYTENSKMLEIDVTCSDATKASRQGALAIGIERTAVMTASDGNFDTALKISAKNKAASEAYARTRGIDVSVKCDNSGNGSHSVHGAYITAEAESGTDLGGELIGLQVNSKQNGTATGASVYALKVYDESQSGTGTNYALHIDCTNNSPFTREYCMYINSGASSGWTNGMTFDGNIANVFDFADTDGTNGANYNASAYTPGNCDGHIQVDIGGNTLYIACYDAMS